MTAAKQNATEKPVAKNTEPAPPRKPPVTVEGTVTSDKMAKTRVVQSVRLVRHPKYGKYLRRYTRYYVDDPKNEAHVGDRVQIAETRPLSRLKRWRLVRILERSVSGEGFTAAEPSSVIAEAGLAADAGAQKA